MIGLKSLIQNLRKWWYENAFDPDFYLDHYDDLQTLRSHKRARKHYAKYGKVEGRFPNLASYLKAHAADLRASFDPVAYRHFNKDVAARFSQVDELFNHYVRHGHKEGRISRFPGGDLSAEALPLNERWKSLFSPVEFIAWCGHQLPERPLSRSMALDLFETSGIDNLWPVNLEYRFDAEFVRANRLMPHAYQTSDAELYRAWLTKGFPAGIAPNETIFLLPYLGGAPFPCDFDWKSFKRESRIRSRATRSETLAALFRKPARVILRAVNLLGADAAWLLFKIASHALACGKPRKAVVLLEHAIAIEVTAERLSLLADTLLRLGKIEQALAKYSAATDREDCPLSAFLAAATIHANLRSFSASFAMLRKVQPTARGQAAFGKKLEEIIEAYFNCQSAHAHALYRDAAKQGSQCDLRSEADDLLASTLDNIQDLYLEMGTLPFPTGGTRDGYVTILADDGLKQCTHYRIEQKVFQFERAGVPVRIFTLSEVREFMDSLIGARAAIFYRVAATPPVLKTILHANAMKLPTYYEIDDLIFDPTCYPDPFESFEGQISITEYTGLQFGVPLFRHALKACQSFIASTPALAHHMQPLTSSGTGIVVRNGLDERNEEAVLMGSHPLRRGKGKVRIFYGSGTKAHNADFNNLVGGALLDLMRRNPNVELVIVGYLKLMSEFDEFKLRIRTYPFLSDLTAYWSILASCDINLAVLEPSRAADCKSEIKLLEAAILQVPSIVSETQTYRDVIKPGIDGILADRPEQWAVALERMVANPHVRCQIGSNARKHALKCYNLQVSAEVLAREFSSFKDESRKLVDRPLRVLICNVFFAPQSHGGATRVVQDNVDEFVENYPDLEVGVFCSDEGGAEPGRLTLESQKGVPVYRLSIRPHSDMEWTPFDEMNAGPFARVVDHFQPDVIHFHCIQRLTASIVEITKRRGIPYVVTLHDAWWISDNQFLIDRDGLHMPTTDVLDGAATSRDPVSSLTRRQRLAALLNHAYACLSVSAAFSRVYEQAGIVNLSVAENGTTLHTQTCSRNTENIAIRGDGRVSLGHIGTRTLHKGAALVEAALWRTPYRNLHLTLVDNALATGQSVNTIWGTTPVTIIPPVPQSKVGQLYTELDVLIAPSLWPESFGLVTREAMHFGLWVVASNLGAIGDDIIEGQNGHIIDVSDAKDLVRILSRIDANPELYRKPPRTPLKPPRSTADQAVQLHAIYREANRVVGEQNKGH